MNPRHHIKDFASSCEKSFSAGLLKVILKTNVPVPSHIMKSQEGRKKQDGKEPGKLADLLLSFCSTLTVQSGVWFNLFVPRFFHKQNEHNHIWSQILPQGFSLELRHWLSKDIEDFEGYWLLDTLSTTVNCPVRWAGALVASGCWVPYTDLSQHMGHCILKLHTICCHQ